MGGTHSLSGATDDETAVRKYPGEHSPEDIRPHHSPVYELPTPARGMSFREPGTVSRETSETVSSTGSSQENSQDESTTSSIERVGFTIMAKKQKDSDSSPYSVFRSSGTIAGEELRARTTRRADGSMLKPPPIRLKERVFVATNNIDFDYSKKTT